MDQVPPSDAKALLPGLALGLLVLLGLGYLLLRSCSAG
jgi:hypothetical protein